MLEDHQLSCDPVALKYFANLKQLKEVNREQSDMSTLKLHLCQNGILLGATG